MQAPGLAATEHAVWLPVITVLAMFGFILAGTSRIAFAVHDDDLFQLTAGYAFANGVQVDAGYRFTDEAGSDKHIVGTRLVYSLSF